MPQVNIDPPGDRHVKADSQVRIDCHITDVVQIPDYIFWYHDNVRVLDRTDENLDVSVASINALKNVYAFYNYKFCRFGIRNILIEYSYR